MLSSEAPCPRAPRTGYPSIWWSHTETPTEGQRFSQRTLEGVAKSIGLTVSTTSDSPRDLPPDGTQTTCRVTLTVSSLVSSVWCEHLLQILGSGRCVLSSSAFALLPEILRSWAPACGACRSVYRSRSYSRARRDVVVMARDYDDRDGRHDRDSSDRRREDKAGRHDRSLDKAGRHDRDRESHRRHESSDRPRDSERHRDRHLDKPRDRHERVRDRSRERSRERLKSRDRDSERDRGPNASDRYGHAGLPHVPMYQPCSLWDVCLCDLSDKVTLVPW